MASMRPRQLALGSLLALSVALTLASPATVVAGPKEAITFYEQAQQAYEQGDFQRAADLLERAFAEDPNLIYQYNRILALQAAGQHEEALRLLNIYENRMRSDEEKRFDDIAQIKTKIERAIEDKKAATTPKDPVVKDPVVKDPVVKDPALDDPNQAKPQEGSSNVLAWALIGTGGVALGAGLLFSTGALLPDEKLPSGAPNPDYNDALSTQKTLAAVTLIGGALLAGGGVALLLLSDDAPAQEDAGKPADTSWRFSPVLAPGHAGAMLHGSF